MILNDYCDCCGGKTVPEKFWHECNRACPDDCGACKGSVRPDGYCGAFDNDEIIEYEVEAG